MRPRIWLEAVGLVALGFGVASVSTWVVDWIVYALIWVLWIVLNGRRTAWSESD